MANRIFLLSLATLISSGAAADFTLDLPDNWQSRTHFMGNELVARPDAESDLKGWGQDLITLTTEPGKKSDTLDRFVQAKLAQLQYHSSALNEAQIQKTSLRNQPARELRVRYHEGSREIQALLLIHERDGQFITVTALTSPERFSAKEKAFRSALYSVQEKSLDP